MEEQNNHTDVCSGGGHLFMLKTLNTDNCGLLPKLQIHNMQKPAVQAGTNCATA